MKANPVGQIDTQSVIGRERLIGLLWETVELQSLIITAERRIGKTTVMRKLEREPSAGWLATDLPGFGELSYRHGVSHVRL
jgi:stage III sporulation protein SpoIIIAA